MSSSDVAIRVQGLSKCYEIYDTPQDRLKQFVLPYIQRLIGQTPKQYFREFWALKDVSFEIRKGETVGIIGRNGSGKSTLLQMICGTLSPTSGNIQTHGRIAALLELGSGFDPEFTGRENVYINAAVLGLSNEEIDSRFDEIAAFADIGEFIDQPVKTYSSGMMVRLAFSVSINVDPEILIVDEALSVGDELFQRKCFSRIEDIKKAGCTILFVTHATQTVLELCGRGLLLKQGHSIFFGNSHRAVNLYYKTTANLNEDLIVGATVGDLHTDSFNIKNPVDANVRQALGMFYASNEPLQDLVSDEHLPFDALLASQTRHEIHNKQYGVTVSNIGLKSISGVGLNILRPHVCYAVSFDVAFEEPCNNISYQVLFKTVNGVPLAGDKFFHYGITAKAVSPSSQVRIIYQFKCLMNAGVYFISIEVCGKVSDQQVIFHKFAEVLAFRVLETENSSAIGYTSLMSCIDIRGV